MIPKAVIPKAKTVVPKDSRLAPVAVASQEIRAAGPLAPVSKKVPASPVLGVLPKPLLPLVTKRHAVEPAAAPPAPPVPMEVCKEESYPSFEEAEALEEAEGRDEKEVESEEESEEEFADFGGDEYGFDSSP